jgi:Zn-finger nucleic acid-binding protein
MRCLHARGVMTDRTRLGELDKRIAAVRENIRVLTEQAAAYSGSADEERNAERIAEQDSLLTKLLKERDVLNGETS